jgi:hypothetical protein
MTFRRPGDFGEGQPTNAPMLIEPCAATSWKVDVLEKIADNYASASPRFISQIASVLEIALTMLTLERKKMHGTFVFFPQLT